MSETSGARTNVEGSDKQLWETKCLSAGARFDSSQIPLRSSEVVLFSPCFVRYPRGGYPRGAPYFEVKVTDMDPGCISRHPEQGMGLNFSALMVMCLSRCWFGPQLLPWATRNGRGMGAQRATGHRSARWGAPMGPEGLCGQMGSAGLCSPCELAPSRAWPSPRPVPPPLGGWFSPT